AADPDPRQAALAAGIDPVAGTHANQYVLEIAHVAMRVGAIRLQVDDRIPHELPRPVIRDVAAASGLEQPDTGRREFEVALEDVISRVTHLHAERDDVGMLEQQQGVVDLAGLAAFDEAALL